MENKRENSLKKLTLLVFVPFFIGCASQSDSGRSHSSNPQNGVEVSKEESFNDAQDLKEESELLHW